MTTTIDSTQPAQAPATKNAFQRIAGVFFSPGETFADIARRPDILVPLLVILAIGYVTTFMVMPHLDWDAMIAQQAEMVKKQNPNVGDDDVARMGRITRSMGTVMSYLAPLLVIVGYLIIALVIWGACRMMGGEGNFKQAFSTTLYAHFPRVLLGIVAAVVVMARGMVDPSTMATVVKSSPAFLVDMKEQPVLFSLLGSLEIFQIWTIVLLVIGFAALTKLSRAKTAAIVVSLWVIMVVVKLGFAALGAARMKA
ncbi:MAG TPA: Yip1 family protein [Thermoanaerobaculia bacterium]